MMQVSRRNLFAFFGGLAVLGRTKPSESKHVGVSEGPQGRKLFAVCDWGPGSDIGVTVVYWRGEDGNFYIRSMHECTAVQVEEDRCPCRNYFPGTRLHHEDGMGHFLERDAAGWKRLVLPAQV